MGRRLGHIIVYYALLALLGMSVGLAHLDLGRWQPLATTGVALVMVALIMWFYMHLDERGWLVRLFAVGGFLWLNVLFVLAIADWLTR